MKQYIRVVSSRQPLRGKFVPEAACEYFKTNDDEPAMRFRWQGLMFKGDKDVFIFPRDATAIGRTSDKLAKSQARMAGFTAGSQHSAGGGLIVSLIGGALRAGVATTSNITGIGVYYKNPDSEVGAFIAVADPAIIDEIIGSMPEDRILDQEVQ